MPVSTRIYIGDALGFGGQPTLDDLISVGYSTVLAWSVHVADGTGDLFVNDTTIVSNGRYQEARPAWRSCSPFPRLATTQPKDGPWWYMGRPGASSCGGSEQRPATTARDYRDAIVNGLTPSDRDEDRARP